MESERRLAVDDGFNAAIQEILQVEDVIFTWRSRGVLNDTISIYKARLCVCVCVCVCVSPLNSSPIGLEFQGP